MEAAMSPILQRTLLRLDRAKRAVRQERKDQAGQLCQHVSLTFQRLSMRLSEH